MVDASAAAVARDCTQRRRRVVAVRGDPAEPRSAVGPPVRRVHADSAGPQPRFPVESRPVDASPQHRPTWRDYYELGKPRVVMLIMITAVAGMFLATPVLPPANALIFGTLGIALAASAAAAINHVLDRRFDAQMARTRNRPLPTGHLSERQALTYAFILGVISMTAAVGLRECAHRGAHLLRAHRLRRRVHRVAEACDAAEHRDRRRSGRGAASARLDGGDGADRSAMRLLLFLIIFTWTPPHFWALAIARRDEYAKAGIPMLPVAYGADFTRLHILLYTILLVIVTLLPVSHGHERPHLSRGGARARRRLPVPRVAAQDAQG